MPPFEVVYDQKYRSLICYENVRDMRIIGLKII